MAEITKNQVSKIVKQVSKLRLKSYRYKSGNYNDHCLVKLENGKEYVIRISKKGWPQII